jgi:hypothetical protein
MIYQSPCCRGYLLRLFRSFGVFECERCHRTYPIADIIEQQNKQVGAADSPLQDKLP